MAYSQSAYAAAYRPSSSFNPSSYAWSAYSSPLQPPKTGGGYIGGPRPLGFQSLLSSQLMGWQAGTNLTEPSTKNLALPPGMPGGAGAAAGGGRPSIPNIANLDVSSDPILQKIKALTDQQISDANAEALRQRTQLAIGYGDPALAAQLGLSKGVQKQAGGNTFGTLQELARGYTRRNVFDINRPLSDQANLFYSSERGRQLALSGEQNLRDRSQAQGLAQQRAAEITQQLLQAKLQAQQQLIAAEEAAYQRALQSALYSAGV